MKFVYFIQRENGEGPIKIGSAKNVGNRLSTLSSGSPYQLSILASFVGGVHVERALHHRFQADRLHGEWFSTTPELLSLILDVKRGLIGSSEIALPLSLSSQEFIASGERLFGSSGWQKRLADTLKMNPATINRYARGHLTIPVAVELALRGLESEK